MLRGTPRTPDYPIKNGPTLSKAIGVFGSLELHGIDPGITWTALNNTAQPGDAIITLRETVGWEVGSEIVISTSSYEANEAEVRRIVGVSQDGRTLTLDSELLYTHLGVTHTLSDGSLTYSLASKVGLLSRNIVIQGEEYSGLKKDSFGGRVIVGEIFTNNKIYTGSGQLSNVEFHHMGQEGWTQRSDPRFSLAFTLGGSTTSFVRKCSFNYNFNNALGVFGCEDMEITDNVVYHTVGHSITCTEGYNHLIHNLVVLVVFPGTYNGRLEEFNLEWSAGFIIGSREAVFKDNCVAGSERLGFFFHGESCGSGEISTGNEAHGVLHGLQLLYSEGHSPCTRLSNLFIWKAWDYGIFFHVSSSVKITSVVLVDCNVAVLPIIYNPPAKYHQFENKKVRITQSFFIGRDPSFNCETDTKPRLASFRSHMRSPKTPSGGKSGIIWGNFLSEKTGGPKNKWHNTFAYPLIRGETIISDVTFSNYGKSSCGKQIDYAMITNRDMEDCHHPITTSQINFVDTSHQGRLFVHRPKLSDITPSNCVDMDCDGQKKILIRDLDGSVIGNGIPGTIIPQSQYEWNGDRRRGLGDFRIPLPVITSLDGRKIDIDDIAPCKGIYGNSNCTWHSDWLMFSCHHMEHRMLVVESLDRDSEIRRLSPVSVLGNKGRGGCIDLVNGPQDVGWCNGYTCQERLSTFYTLVVLKETFEITFTSTPPQRLRFHLLNAKKDEALIVKVWFPKKQRYDISHNRFYVNPTNGDWSSGSLRYILPDPDNPTQYYPTLQSNLPGENYYERETGFVIVHIRGAGIIDITTKPVVVLATGLLIDEDSFFEYIIKNLADFFGLDESQIVITNIVREDSKRQKRGASEVTVEFQIGAPNSNNTNNDTIISYSESREEALKAAEAIINGFQQGKITDLEGIQGVTKINVVIPSSEPPPPPPSVDEDSVEDPKDGQEPLGVIANREAAFNTSAETLVFEIPDALVVDQDVEETQHSMAVISPAPRVYIANAQGEAIQAGLPEAAWVVKVSLTGGSDASELVGTTEVVNVDGWARFDDIRVTKPGISYRLHFSISSPNASLSADGSLFDVEPPAFLIKINVPPAAVVEDPLDPPPEVIMLRSDGQQLKANQQGYTWLCILSYIGAAASGASNMSFLPGETSVVLDSLSASTVTEHFRINISCSSDPVGPDDLHILSGPVLIVNASVSGSVGAVFHLLFEGRTTDTNQTALNEALLAMLTVFPPNLDFIINNQDINLVDSGTISVHVHVIGSSQDIRDLYSCLTNPMQLYNLRTGSTKFVYKTLTYFKWDNSSLFQPDGTDGQCRVLLDGKPKMKSKQIISQIIMGKWKKQTTKLH